MNESTGPVAQSVVSPTAEPGATSLIPTCPILLWKWNNFYSYSPPSADSRRVLLFFVSYKQQNVHKGLVNSLVKPYFIALGFSFAGYDKPCTDVQTNIGI